jgi:hypothetical protein
MAKFIQICASQDDVFALDDQGDVYRYNFNVKAWAKLIGDRHSEEQMPGARVWNAGDGVAVPGEPARQSRLFGQS